MTRTTIHTSAAGRTFLTAATTLSLVVGALQMFHFRGGWVTNYGADVFGTAWMYAIVRQGATVLQRGRRFSAGATAAVVFAGCTGTELGQRLGVVPGRFDALDIVAFCVTVLACYALDRRIALA